MQINLAGPTVHPLRAAATCRGRRSFTANEKPTPHQVIDKDIHAERGVESRMIHVG